MTRQFKWEGQPWIEDEHLGDGVYVSWDGYMFWLDLRAQDSTTAIAMEPSVIEALQKYVARANELIAREAKK